MLLDRSGFNCLITGTLLMIRLVLNVFECFEVTFWGLEIEELVFASWIKTETLVQMILLYLNSPSSDGTVIYNNYFLNGNFAAIRKLYSIRYGH